MEKFDAHSRSSPQRNPGGSLFDSFSDPLRSRPARMAAV